MLHQEARKYLGVKFTHQGRLVSSGIDCIGLLVLSMRDMGFKFDDFTNYSRQPHAGLLESHLERVLGKPKDTLEVGDIVAIKYLGPIRHVGIIGDHPDGISLIHTDSGVGRVVEHRIDEKWMRRIKQNYRMPE